MNQENNEKRLERIEKAILYLAECIDDGSWGGIRTDVSMILSPPKRETLETD